MNLHRQLTRAIVSLLAIAGFATAEKLLASAQVQCPLGQASVSPRFLLLDPVQKHPIWIDAAAAGTQCGDRILRSATSSCAVAWPSRDEMKGA